MKSGKEGELQDVRSDSEEEDEEEKGAKKTK